MKYYTVATIANLQWHMELQMNITNTMVITKVGFVRSLLVFVSTLTLVVGDWFVGAYFIN